MKQNQAVGVAVIKSRPGQEPTTFLKHKKAQDTASDIAEADAHRAQRIEDDERMSQEFFTLAEKLAHTNIFIKNVSVMPLVEAFPGQFMNWNVAQVFPHAKGGPLYVDYAPYEFDVEQCRRKNVIMRKWSLRYVWIEPNDTIESAERKLKGELK